MSTNVFSAFKLDKPAVRAIRSDLASLVRDYIEGHGWTQIAAAKKLGIPQPTVSNIMSGNTRRLSVDYLIDLLDRLNIPWSARRWDSSDDACAGYGANQAMAWLGFPAMLSQCTESSALLSKRRGSREHRAGGDAGAVSRDSHGQTRRARADSIRGGGTEDVQSRAA